MTPLCICAEFGAGCTVANVALALGLVLIGALLALAGVGLAMLAGDKNGG